jgi:hypothetical protein
VWKHLPLVEILSIERPSQYWESHAGSATYEMVDDAERRYGVLTFLEVAPRLPALARSRYLAHLGPAGRPATYPGSPMLAALELGPACSYLFCDLDPGSVANLRAAARRLGLAPRTQVVDTDGMAALHRAAHACAGDGPTLSTGDGSTVAHIDPYEPRAVAAGGRSALDLARELIERRIGIVYWYGYDRPEHRAWAFDALSAGARGRSVWCGDVMVTAPGFDATGGDLGEATTPGTGFGIVCANISAAATQACRQLGEELATAYDGVPLPDGRPGRLRFATRSTAPRSDGR